MIWSMVFYERCYWLFTMMFLACVLRRRFPFHIYCSNALYFLFQFSDPFGTRKIKCGLKIKNSCFEFHCNSNRGDFIVLIENNLESTLSNNYITHFISVCWMERPIEHNLWFLNSLILLEWEKYVLL